VRLVEAERFLEGKDPIAGVDLSRYIWVKLSAVRPGSRRE